MCARVARISPWRPAIRGGGLLNGPKPFFCGHFAMASSFASHPSARRIRWRRHVVAPSCWNCRSHAAGIGKKNGLLIHRLRRRPRLRVHQTAQCALAGDCDHCRRQPTSLTSAACNCHIIGNTYANSSGDTDRRSRCRAHAAPVAAPKRRPLPKPKQHPPHRHSAD